MQRTDQRSEKIVIRGANQNNLKNINIDLPTNELIVITGVSGSGKSTFAFDTLYAEGQRRYVETFSPYARQFLDRMDKPSIESIEGIPPAIAIEQSNPVRTSRSTVGTMTEINDYIKLLFARLSDLYCHQCDQPVHRDSVPSIIESLFERFSNDQRCMICLPITVPDNFSNDEVIQLLNQQGYTRIHTQEGNRIEVVQDRFVLRKANRARLSEALESALLHGKGEVIVYPLNADKQPGKPIHFSSKYHCAICNIDYTEASPALFSFNSPVGACESCKGFGRLIGVDYGLVIPDESKSLAEGAVKPFQTESNKDIQRELIKQAKKRNIPIDTPWKKLTHKQQRWVIEGEGRWSDGLWFGIGGFFRYLESKSYKMHMRVLLSKYRSYTTCTECQGARLKPDALWWYLSSQDQRLTIHDVMQLSLEEAFAFFNTLSLPQSLDEPAELLLSEVRTRLHYLLDVGLSYLTLDRQSRTLSGGELQRINLTTALGTSLVNTLFVLDEPSIGLHSRDIHRLIGILHRLRDAGNTVLVVEHDPEVMMAADRIIDIGPGPGRQGGEIQFYGTPKALLKSRQSLTADYLSGRKQVSKDESVFLSNKLASNKLPPNKQPSTKQSSTTSPQTQLPQTPKSLKLIGAQAHNLKAVDLIIPLNQLVCITGVSGSGKSTLMREVLYPALCKSKGKPTEQPGAYKRLVGDQHIEDAILVDQSPIGKTTRSTPATYVGAFDAIRKRFAKSPLAKERSYTAGTFSYNSGNGRCPTCAGNGFEHVEMQFLSDVYIRCADCDGKRYRAETLEVKLFAAADQQADETIASIADVLAMTVSEAIHFFQDAPEIVQSLQPLVDVGLNYLALGQAVPTLSGGESQRLKLAGHIVSSTQQKRQQQTNTLFLFDEPTTGLHFSDIHVLMGAFHQLLRSGHSLLIIEHNLDVIANADWIIDIGPEGGAAGGEIIAEGTPKTIMDSFQTETAKALKGYKKAQQQQKALLKRPLNTVKPQKRTRLKKCIEIRHAREHNLKNIDLTIPREQFSVITGVSGSGKSTIAFDIIFAEGQRRYLESLNAYARQFIQSPSKPDLDAIHGIPPTVAIEQRTSRGGRKSTAATLTEVYHFMRLLFVKLGDQYCPDCDQLIEPQSLEKIVANIMQQYKGIEITVLAPLVVARKGIYKELAQWATQKGYPELRVDGQYESTEQWPKLDRYKEHNIELPMGQLTVQAKQESSLIQLLSDALTAGNGVIVIEPINASKNASKTSSKKREQRYSIKRACASCGQGFDELDPRLFSYNSKHGWCEVCYGTGEVIRDFTAEDSGEEEQWLEVEHGDSEVESVRETCSACNGQRLNPMALAVKFRDQSIADLAELSFEQAYHWFNKLKLKKRENEIARDLLPELTSRLHFMNRVGLGYLSLDRAAPTLSGGEAQRIRLASQLGSNLQGVCYVLDEPSIGLHARDNERLIETLRELQLQGNTVLVVEHDEATIKEADYIIDIGPEAGVNGGEVVASGSLAQLKKDKRSITGQMIANPIRHPMESLRDESIRAAYEQEQGKQRLTIHDAVENNLKTVSVDIPLRQLVAVSGVSGSGKSTLIRSVLHKNLKRALPTSGSKRSVKGKKTAKATQWSGCSALSGWESIGRVIEVDQTPIGKTSRSCPATYIGIWDAIRKLFAGTVDARLRGYTPARFSFNTGSGRCDGCGGLGLRKIEMSFLPDVRVECEQCKGWRFNDETLRVEYKDKHIGDVLAMDIDTAVDYFSSIPSVHHVLTLLQDVGLGYLTLGQQSQTLSGGEAQRIKLVAELAKAKMGIVATTPQTLYILDEPTVGLHMADVEKLIKVLHRLVDAGNSVIVVEHNLDVIAEADWVIDMGPDGGDKGGKVVAQGTPETLCRRKRSVTGDYLQALFA